MADVGLVVEIALHQEVVLAGGRIDLRYLLDAARIVSHVISLPELALHHDEDRLHGPLPRGRTLPWRTGEESGDMIAEAHRRALVAALGPALAALLRVRLVTLRPVLWPLFRAMLRPALTVWPFRPLFRAMLALRPRFRARLRRRLVGMRRLL